MFCNQCGGLIQPGQNFCAQCGRPAAAALPAAAAPAAPSIARGRVARPLSVLAILWIVISVFRLFGAGGVMFAGHFVRHAVIGDPVASRFLPALFPGIAMFLLLGAVIGFICGWGLLQKYAWARTLGLVLGALSLLDLPLGTALGIYTLWVLLPSQSEQEYQALARP